MEYMDMETPFMDHASMERKLPEGMSAAYSSSPALSRLGKTRTRRDYQVDRTICHVPEPPSRLGLGEVSTP